MILTETEVQPVVDMPPSWPPVAHIVHKKDYPIKEGSIALCGAKLMGIDLRGMSVNQLCKECAAIRHRLLGL
jgi:hypothetical protein